MECSKLVCLIVLNQSQLSVCVYESNLLQFETALEFCFCQLINCWRKHLKIIFLPTSTDPHQPIKVITIKDVNLIALRVTWDDVLRLLETCM